MAKQKEFFVFCPHCHDAFLTSREEFHKPVILYDKATWISSPDSELEQLNQLFVPDSPLIDDLVTHHKTVGHHLFHNIYVLFENEIDFDDLNTAPGEKSLKLRYPDAIGLLYTGAGGQIILWKKPDNVQEVDIIDFGS